MEKEYDLDRFVRAQEPTYQNALMEIQSGLKRTHWMWFIFPQLRVLGESRNSLYYGIENIEEAKQYLAHPILGARLREISEVLISLETKDPFRVMPGIDGVKLCSSMTLFAQIEGDSSVFKRVIDKFYNGNKDAKTLRILNSEQ